MTEGAAWQASWWLTRRTVEVDQTFTSGDIFQIVRDLIDYMTETA